MGSTDKYATRLCLKKSDAFAHQESLDLSDEELADCSSLVLNAVHNSLTMPNGQWLFLQSHLSTQVEHPIAWRDGMLLRESRLDLVLIDQEERHWIIDFKLVEHSSNRESELRSRYETQLSHYARIYREKLRSEANLQTPENLGLHCALYLPLNDKLLILNEN